MASDFLSRLSKSPILCDGAMGTLLYANGVFINRSYDELNLSQPEMLHSVHQGYLQAGAEIREPNPFGANSVRLGRYSLADKVHEINRAGARLARDAAKSFDVWVAGSVGPIGIRIEPLGKTSFAEARAAFRDQIAALNEGGVNLLILETFGYVEELHQALLAARDVNRKLPGGAVPSPHTRGPRPPLPARPCRRVQLSRTLPPRNRLPQTRRLGRRRDRGQLQHRAGCDAGRDCARAR